MLHLKPREFIASKASPESQQKQRPVASVAQYLATVVVGRSMHYGVGQPKIHLLKPF